MRITNARSYLDLRDLLGGGGGDLAPVRQLRQGVLQGAIDVKEM